MLHAFYVITFLYANPHFQYIFFSFNVFKINIISFNRIIVLFLQYLYFNSNKSINLYIKRIDLFDFIAFYSNI